MKISMALVADEANLSQDGKLNVLGVFDRIAAPAYPMIHPKMVYVFRLEARYGDGGSPIPVRVRLTSEDGTSIFDAGGEIVAPDVPPGDFATTHQLFALHGVRFPKPGIYSFVVHVGDLLPHETPIAVVQAGWTPEASGQGN